MKWKSEYENKVEDFFKTNYLYILNAAKNIKQVHYSIPLEIEDLISYTHLKLLESENKIKYFEAKNNNQNTTLFFKRKIYTNMWTYCNIYKSKNHQILNNINFDENESIINLANENYNYNELFSFLTSSEFTIIYDLYVSKMKRIDIAKKLNISKHKLKIMEYEARNKICKFYNIHF